MMVRVRASGRSLGGVIRRGGSLTLLMKLAGGRCDQEQASEGCIIVNVLFQGYLIADREEMF